MKKYALLLLLLSIHFFVQSQSFAIGLDKMNIFYAGIDNPVTIAVEGVSIKSLVLKCTSGKIIEKGGRYIFRTEKPGNTNIIVYKKINNELVLIGQNAFRVKLIPAPVFRIGSGRAIVPKAELCAQQFARVDLENFDFDLKYNLDSFTVSIFYRANCQLIKKTNTGSRINDDIRQAFTLLKEDDILIVKNIQVHYNSRALELTPVLIRVKE